MSDDLKSGTRFTWFHPITLLQMNRYLILLLVLCFITGCKKNLSYSYAFNVNGVVCRGDNYTAVYHLDTAAALQEFAANFYVGNVTDTTYVQVSFSGNNYVVPGTYYSGIINPYNTICSFAYNKNHTYYSNVTGLVQITQIDTVAHKLRGSFQFRAVSNVNANDTVTITNGGFSGINYIIE